jgi:hypothetical protein
LIICVYIEYIHTQFRLGVGLWDYLINDLFLVRLADTRR